MNIKTVFKQEPLLRFGIVGLAIFAANALLSKPIETGDPQSINISQSRIDEWSTRFRRSNGQAPTADEVKITVQQWADEEVLFRQALLLGLHQNDSIVRRQLIQKMNFVIEGAAPLPPASDDKLQAFLAQNPTAYEKPAKTSLQQVFFSRGNHGNSLPNKAQKLLEALQQSEPEHYKGKGDSFILGQRISNASDQLLRKHFGEKFVTAIKTLPESTQWQGPVESGLGLHLVRITKHRAPEVPTLDNVRKKVAIDYRLHQEQIARRKALDKLHERYRVTIESDDSDKQVVVDAQ